jgi:xylulokinase
VIVGIDIGTQSLKAVVADERLRPLGEATVAYEPRYPRAGWAEQDPVLWEQALAPAIGRALAAAGTHPQRVDALGLCGQLDGCIPTDAQGRALGACIIWSDRRAQAELPAIDPARVRHLTGVVLDPTHMAAKIRWLKTHAPEGARAARFHQPVSYLVARLTGEHVFDHALASTTMLYSLHRRAFESELLDAFGITAQELPALGDADACAGRLHARGAELTGLPTGVPVAVGTGDDFSNPLGAGLVTPGRVACTLGTAEVVGALHPKPAIDASGMLETHGYAGALFFIENPGWLSGGAVSWLLRILDVADAAALDAMAATAPPGSDGVVFLPALSGAMTPEWIASARGCFYGLTARHERSHLARALLEGCAFAMRDVIERLAQMGVAGDAILLLGGGARSALWAGIRADLSGLAVEVPVVHDTSPLGAALLASVAAGIHPGIAAAAAHIAGAASRVDPTARHRAALDGAYARYRRLFESLRPMYEAPS